MRPPSGLVGSVLAAVLSLLPLVPPIHAHEVHELGADHTVVHRHGGGHGGGDDEDDHEHRQSSVDHDAAAWSLDAGVYDVPQLHDTLSASLPATRIRYIPLAVRAPRARLDDPLIHAPPRTSLSVRAPPISLA